MCDFLLLLPPHTRNVIDPYDICDGKADRMLITIALNRHSRYERRAKYIELKEYSYRKYNVYKKLSTNHRKRKECLHFGKR